jgi:hypothetical protein
MLKTKVVLKGGVIVVDNLTAGRNPSHFVASLPRLKDEWVAKWARCWQLTQNTSPNSSVRAAEHR